MAVSSAPSSRFSARLNPSGITSVPRTVSVITANSAASASALPGKRATISFAKVLIATRASAWRIIGSVSIRSIASRAWCNSVAITSDMVTRWSSPPTSVVFDLVIISILSGLRTGRAMPPGRDRDFAENSFQKVDG